MAARWLEAFLEHGGEGGGAGERVGHLNMRASSPSSSVSTADSDSTRVFSPRMGYGTARLERDTTTCGPALRALTFKRVLRPNRQRGNTLRPSVLTKALCKRVRVQIGFMHWHVLSILCCRNS